MDSGLPISRAALSTVLASPVTIDPRAAKPAGEFEAQLIGSLLESMEKTFAALPGEESVPGTDDYSYLGTCTLSEALAARGGFGIGAMISRYLSAHEGRE